MKKFLYLSLSWFFGSLFLLAGLVSAFMASLLGGLCLLIISSMLLPPVRSFVYSKTNKTMPMKVKAISIIILLVMGPIFVGIDQHQQSVEEDAKRAATTRQQTIDYFSSHREQIIAGVQAALASKEYRSAITQAKKYLVSGDTELREMHNNAQGKQAAIHKANKTRTLLAELKTIPAREYAKNANRYQQLVNLHPNDKAFAEKLSFYLGKVNEENQKQRDATARKTQIEKQFSPWDGSHKQLERYIKTIMNDPDSYDHVETVYWDRGDFLIIKTTFRGNNAFGGKVINSIRAKVSLNGEVLEILE